MSKRIPSTFIIFISTVLLFIGCSNSDNDYSKFLSDKEGKYSLYIVAKEIDTITFDSLQENDIDNVKTISHDTSISGARLDEIKEMPTFMVFDTKNKVFKTDDITELYEFLHDN